MTENLAGRGEGLAGHSERVMRTALLAIINMAHRAWEDKTSVETMFRLIGKRAKGALEAAAPAGTAHDEPQNHNAWGLRFKGTVKEPIDAWRWQADGEDHLASLANNALVLIRAADLRALATPSPQAPTCICGASSIFPKISCPVHGLQEPAGSGATFKYFPLPWSAPDGEPDGAHCLDANGQMCMVIMWPVHPVEETEAVEQEAYRLMRLIPQLLNAAPGSPRKVGEEGAQTFEQWWASIHKFSTDSDRLDHTVWVLGRPFMARKEAAELAWNAALARSSSVPVGEQKQEEGV